MKTRDSQILETRPDVPVIKNTAQMGTEEKFQNNTLRPIIIFQNDLLVEVFRNYIKKHKNVFYDLTVEQRLKFIENALQKDIKFRNFLKGMVTGNFTGEEYKIYIQNPSALNKRMMYLVKESLLSNIQLLENN